MLMNYVILRAHSAALCVLMLHENAGSNSRGRRNARAEGECIICQDWAAFRILLKGEGAK